MESAVLAPEKQQLLNDLRHETEVAAERMNAKRDYLRSVRGAGSGIETIATMQRSFKHDKDRIVQADEAIERIERLLAFGFEPTTPPDWYCGHLAEPKDQRPETWPRKDRPAGGPEAPTLSDGWFSISMFMSGTGYRVYKGAIPAEAVRRYATAKPLLDDVRVYSPREEDFQFVSLEPADPVLIGSVEVLGQPSYFEIARWDIDRDLAEVFAS